MKLNKKLETEVFDYIVARHNRLREHVPLRTDRTVKLIEDTPFVFIRKIGISVKEYRQCVIRIDQELYRIEKWNELSKNNNEQINKIEELHITHKDLENIKNTNIKILIFEIGLILAMFLLVYVNLLLDFK